MHICCHIITDCAIDDSDVKSEVKSSRHWSVNTNVISADIRNSLPLANNRNIAQLKSRWISRLSSVEHPAAGTKQCVNQPISVVLNKGRLCGDFQNAVSINGANTNLDDDEKFIRLDFRAAHAHTLHSLLFFSYDETHMPAPS